MRRVVVSELMKLQKREVQETSEVDSFSHLCKEKARILKEFSTDSKNFAKWAGYLSGPDKGSNQKLEQALVLARQATRPGH